MPLFFFHLRTEQSLDEDTFGVELSGLEAARREALAAISDMIRDAVLTGTELHGDAFEITDQGGRRVLTVPLHVLNDRARAGRNGREAATGE